MQVSVVAVDGPAASGKSTVARALATELGFRSLDTGLIYRIITREVIRAGVHAGDADAVGGLAELVLRGLEIETSGVSSSTVLLVNGVPVSEGDLHTADVSGMVARVSPHDGVRRAVRAIQQRLIREGQIVIAGRDIGTVVAPQAELKLFLDVSLAERASRRLWSQSRGSLASQAQLEDELRQRDDLDRDRKSSPMIPATDAIVLRTDGLSIPDTVRTILQLAGLASTLPVESMTHKDIPPTSQFTVGTYARLNGRVLLLWHDDLNRWVPPGGKIRLTSSEAPHDAAIRHCQEECGLDVELDHPNDGSAPASDTIAVPLPPPAGVQRIQLDQSNSYLDLVYYGSASGREPKLNYRQARAYHWFSIGDLDRYPLYPHVARHTSRCLNVDHVGAPSSGSLQDLAADAREIRRLYDRLNITRFGKPWGRGDIQLGYVTDTGDLVRLLMAEDGTREKQRDHSARLRNEFADSLWSLLVLADLYDIDLSSAYQQLIHQLRTELRA